MVTINSAYGKKRLAIVKDSSDKKESGEISCVESETLIEGIWLK